MAKFKIGDVVDLSHYGSRYGSLTITGFRGNQYILVEDMGYPNREKYCAIAAADEVGSLARPIISIGEYYDSKSN